MKIKRRGPFLIQEATNSRGGVEVYVYHSGFLLHKRWGETLLRHDRPRWAYSKTFSKYGTKHING